MTVVKNNLSKIYFIGIKGVGMTALALFAKEKGYQVSGSDTEENFVTDHLLERAQIPVFEFNRQNLKDKPDLVVVSAAYGKEHPEIKEARKKHLEIKTSSEILSQFASDKKLIAVSGIHGKTTTAALISYLLTKANFDPSFIIGAGEIAGLSGPGHFGGDDYLVAEADEYRQSLESSKPKFFDLSPQIEVITSIEMDHPDMFGSEEEVYQAFYKFACRLPRTGFIVLCTDYPRSYKLLNSLVDRHFETYGFDEGAKWQIVDYQDGEKYSEFFILVEGQKLCPFKIKLPGRANALNATAAIIVLRQLNIDVKIIKKYLPTFSGVKRRFEKIGQIENITIIDDYAHHPRAIKMTLEAAKKRYPGAKIWAVFQPHTYSRTKELLPEFSRSFLDASRVIITDIYASCRENQATISGSDLAAEIRKNQPQVKFISDKTKIIEEIIDNVSEETLIITLGAGDIYKLAQEIWENLKKARLASTEPRRKNEEKN